MTSPPAPAQPRPARTGWTARKLGVALGVVIGSFVLALLAAWGASVALFQLRPPSCDPWDCTTGDVLDVIAVGITAGILMLVGAMVFGFRRFVR